MLLLMLHGKHPPPEPARAKKQIRVWLCALCEDSARGRRQIGVGRILPFGGIIWGVFFWFKKDSSLMDGKFLSLFEDCLSEGFELCSLC